MEVEGASSIPNFCNEFYLQYPWAILPVETGFVLARCPVLLSSASQFSFGWKRQRNSASPEPGERVSKLRPRLPELILGIVVALTFTFIPTVFAQRSGEEAVLWFFWGDGCEMCEEAMGWISYLEETYPDLEIRSREVWFDQKAQDLYLRMLEERKEKASWVPGFILGDKVWHGFNENLTGEIELLLDKKFLEQRKSDPLFGKGEKISYLIDTTLLSRQPLFVATLLLGTVDGFNPCSLWVLAVLLAMILNTRSRVRIAAVGGVFLLVTALVYGLFIAGVFAAMAVISHLENLRWLIGLLALGLAALNLRDFLGGGEQPVLGISSRWKPAIVKSSRQLGKDRPLIFTLLLTVIFAAGVALIELPCTAGFPVIWTGLLREAGIEGVYFLGLLGVYLAAYLFVEVLVVGIVIITMEYLRIQEIYGRRFRLVGGMLMGALGLMLLINPRAIESLGGLILVFAVAGGASLGIMVIQNQRKRWSKI